MMPPISTSLAVAQASTSTSIASSRKRSSSTGRVVGDLAPPRACSARGRLGRTRSPSRGRRARRTAAPPAGSRSRAPRRSASSSVRAVRLGGCFRPSSLHMLLEALAVLGEVDRVGRGADDRHAGGLEARASFSGVWPPNCTITPVGLFLVDDLEHVLERQRLEVQPVRGVVVGGDGLRVAVDHDGLEAVLAQRERRVHAAVVELDALADAVRPAAQDHDLRCVGRLRLALLLVGGVHVGGGGGELGRAGVDALEHRAHAQRVAARAHVVLGVFEQLAPGGCRRSPCASGRAARSASRVAQASASPARLSLGTRSSICARNQGSICGSARISSSVQPTRKASATYQRRSAPGVPQLVARSLSSVIGRVLRSQAVDADLQAAQRLLQRLLEGAADRHHLAHATSSAW